MSRPLAMLALLALALGSGAALAQRPPNTPAPPSFPPRMRHPRGPAAAAPGGGGLQHGPPGAQRPLSAPSGAQPAALQRTTAPDVTTAGSMVLPARSSRSGELLQGAPGIAEPSPSAALTPLPQQPLADAQRAHVRITVRTIRAQHGLGSLEIDGRLRRIDRDLRSFAEQFSYRTYQLLDEQSFDLDTRSAAQVELPGGRALEVEPRLLTPDGQVKLHMELLGQHPEHLARMRTDYSIPHGRTILVVGYRVDPARPEQGTLLIALTQDQ